MQSWETFFQIFRIFGCPWGFRILPFSAKGAVFEVSENLMHFRVALGSLLEKGPPGEGWLLGTCRFCAKGSLMPCSPFGGAANNNGLRPLPPVPLTT